MSFLLFKIRISLRCEPKARFRLFPNGQRLFRLRPNRLGLVRLREGGAKRSPRAGLAKPKRLRLSLNNICAHISDGLA